MGTLGLLAIFLICILIHLPMAFSILLSNLVLSVDGGYSIMSNVSGIFTGCDSFTLLAIPFFMLAGNIMCEGGIADRIINFCESLVGHHTGGFGLITIVACFFGYRRFRCGYDRRHRRADDPDDGQPRLQP